MHPESCFQPGRRDLFHLAAAAAGAVAFGGVDLFAAAQGGASAGHSRRRLRAAFSNIGLQVTWCAQFLAPDNEFMGAAVTQALVDAIGGQGTIIMTQGALGHTGAQGRARGSNRSSTSFPASRSWRRIRRIGTS